MSVINFKQHIFKKLIGGSLHNLQLSHPTYTTMEILTFGAGHVKDSCEQMAQNMQLPHVRFSKWYKRRLLANHIILVVDRGG